MNKEHIAKFFARLREKKIQYNVPDRNIARDWVFAISFSFIAIIGTLSYGIYAYVKFQDPNVFSTQDEQIKRNNALNPEKLIETLRVYEGKQAIFEKVKREVPEVSDPSL